MLPSIFGCEITPAERNIVSLPTRFGGQNIINPSQSCDYSYDLFLRLCYNHVKQSCDFSRRATNVVVDSLKLHSEFDPDAHFNTLSAVRSELHTQKETILDETFNSNIQELNSLQRRAIQHAIETQKISSWLNVLPVAKHHFDLSASEFRDALALCYKKPLLRSPLNSV